MVPEIKKVVEKIADLNCELCIKSIPCPDSLGATWACFGSDSKNFGLEMEPNRFCDCGTWLVEITEVVEDEEGLEGIVSDVYGLDYVTSYALLFNRALESDD